MRKDLDLGGESGYADHSRNSNRGKAGVNRTKRHRVKLALNDGDGDNAAQPAARKAKKRFGIKNGGLCRWYATEQARDRAFDALIKSRRCFIQKLNIPLSWVNRPIAKVER